jgi:hypothetical protein
MPRLNIQIIFYEKKTIYTPFLDKFLGLFISFLSSSIVQKFIFNNFFQIDSKCEYQVTIWGDAWNEYLKRG